jgi:hypothetical protein
MKPREPEPRNTGAPSRGLEQALLVKIALSDTEFGEEKGRSKIQELEDDLITAIEKKPDTGEFAGDEFGNGVCTIYMYGPSAAQLFDVTIPILLKFQAPVGSLIMKRYGGPGEKEDRIPLGQP